MHVDRAFLDISVPAPDPIEQLSARKDPLRVGHEEVQQPILGRSQGNLALAGTDAVAGIVELEPLDLDHVGAAGGPCAAQYRLNARQQLARREGFGDVVVRTALETADLVLLLGSCRQYDDRNLLGI